VTHRVLIIEDEETLRNNLAAFLSKKGYLTQAVSSAAEGIKALGERPYDILITDLYLEDADGLTIVQQLQSWALDATVLVITAYGTLESAIEAFRCGVHDYVLKPFSFDELERKLEIITRHRNLVRENARLRAQL
jgi:DNA-binding NtrC family response regulator